MAKKTLGQSMGKFYMGGSEKFDENLYLENQIQRAKEEKEFKELQERLLDAEKAKQKEIEEKLQSLEGLPTGTKVLLLPYPENPYRKIMDGNIIVDYDGTFNNPDSGETDKLQRGIMCAKVIEVGPFCKEVQVGDDVYYDSRGAYPIPFMSLGYWQISEPQVLFVINEGLSERFKAIKESK